MDSRIGPSFTYASSEPPGMIDGPFSAPSSPPEMPVPTKLRFCSRSDFSRRMVSVKSELPPSTMMSPGSKRSASSLMTASVPAPACTMMIAARGFFRLATNASMSSDGTKSPSSPCFAIMSCVRAAVRL